MIKKVALFDVCHTIVNTSTVREFTESYLRSPKHIIWKILRRLHLVSKEIYRNHYVKLFKGYEKEYVEKLGMKYSEYLQTIFKQKVIEKLRDLKNQGYEVYLVSAGFDAYLKQFAQKLSVKLVCSVLEVDSQGVYTGKFSGIDCYGQGKVEKLREVLDFNTVDWKESFSFGDTSSDIPILSLVGHPYIIGADKELAEHARVHTWKAL